MSYKFVYSPLLRNMLFVAIALGSVTGLGFLADRYTIQRDLTHDASNSLEPASIAVLNQLEGPVKVTVYATEMDARLGDIRKIIRGFLSLYQRYKPDINVVFVDPEKEPERTRAAHAQLNGETVFEYAGRSEHLTQINEQIVTSTLLRLAHSRDQLVMYLDGHGERKLDGIANHDLGTFFGAKLKQNGFRISGLNLALAQEVPRNVSVLVITQPQLDLLTGEIDKIIRYIDYGGNLLWLVDAEALHGLQPLAEKLDLLLPPAVVVDPAASGMNAPTTWSLGATYPPHAITRNFNLITAFPYARPLVWNESSEWKYHALVEVASRGWASRSMFKIKDSKETPAFDKQHDIHGPAIIAAALSRSLKEKDQRIVVVGNGAFLANSYAGNGGNVDLGISMVNWLAGDDQLITLQPRAARDNNLMLSKTELNVIGIGFLLVLPLLLAARGIYVWRSRRTR
ncbi:MAG: GldG family protein [Gallionella sp.]